MSAKKPSKKAPAKKAAAKKAPAKKAAIKATPGIFIKAVLQHMEICAASESPTATIDFRSGAGSKLFKTENSRPAGITFPQVESRTRAMIYSVYGFNLEHTDPHKTLLDATRRKALKGPINLEWFNDVINEGGIGDSALEKADTLNKLDNAIFTRCRQA
ncbi:hypothetical protein [Luteolibacter sp. Populi]|uniref:hypothetical protein n=1 Tax=Luteolibacter sp. Populi TaxID=3230487 RepID=UPI003467597E